MRRRIAGQSAIAVLLLCTAVASRAGGPAFVAGSGYNPGVEGQPLIWANGSVQYFTDQGNLSPILTGRRPMLSSPPLSAPGPAFPALLSPHRKRDISPKT